MRKAVELRWETQVMCCCCSENIYSVGSLLQSWINSAKNKRKEHPTQEENIDTGKIGYGRCIHHSWRQVQDSGVKPVMWKGRNQFEFWDGEALFSWMIKHWWFARHFGKWLWKMCSLPFRRSWFSERNSHVHKNYLRKCIVKTLELPTKWNRRM